MCQQSDFLGWIKRSATHKAPVRVRGHRRKPLFPVIVRPYSKNERGGGPTEAFDAKIKDPLRLHSVGRNRQLPAVGPRRGVWKIRGVGLPAKAGAAAAVIDHVIRSKPHPEQGYRPALSIMRRLRPQPGGCTSLMCVASRQGQLPRDSLEKR
jgi:hypothetical protein